MHIIRALPVCILLVLGSCAAVGPDYHEPAPAAPAAWRAPLPHGGSHSALTGWWSQFNDPVLVGFIERAEADSPTLAKAWSNIDRARATLASSQAAGLPAANAQASVTRSKQPGLQEVSTTRTVNFDASWEIDLFGKVRRGNESVQERIDARVSDWHDARSSLAAEVADTYVQYRACVQLANDYQRELTSMTQTERATNSLVRAGINPSSDGALARASLASTTRSALEQQAQCELLVKSLVALTGTDELALRDDLARGAGSIPAPAAFHVRALPADAVRQRPDVVSRERELAAGSADIGAAEADLYPSLSLGGSITLSGGTGWSFGPSLSVPLFDGGRRRAAVDSARASYQAALADWRQSVRTAIKEVEQVLVRLNSTGRKTELAEASAQDYRRYFEATEAQWRAGAASLLTLEETRRQALGAQLELTGLRRDRVQQWIALYKALGGGWQRGTQATPPRDNNGSSDR